MKIMRLVIQQNLKRWESLIIVDLHQIIVVNDYDSNYDNNYDYSYDNSNDYDYSNNYDSSYDDSNYNNPDNNYYEDDSYDDTAG